MFDQLGVRLTGECSSEREVIVASAGGVFAMAVCFKREKVGKGFGV